ncbi:MAG: 16S rRNA methyltransferase [Thermoplasmata archaeon]
MMLDLILADSELELVPTSIAGHPACVAHARRRNRRASDTLLDSTLHHPALRRLPDGRRRGRPDIVHFFLLTALDSILNLEGGLRVTVHTRNDLLIRPRPDTRLPKSQSRFYSLMEQLFLEGRVPKDGEPLIVLEKGSLKKAVEDSGAERVVALSPQGRCIDSRVYFSRQRGKHLACIIGGFPDGDFLSPVSGIADDVVSISPHVLKVWTVASEVLVNVREKITCMGPQRHVDKALAPITGARDEREGDEREEDSKAHRDD